MEKDHFKQIRKYLKNRAKAQEKGNLKEEAEWVNQLGVVYAQLGANGEALSMHREELGLCEATSDTMGQTLAHRKIGEAFLSLENFPKAVKHHNRQLELATVAKSVPEQQRAYATLGRTYLIWGEDLHGKNGEAKAAFRKSESAFRNAIKLADSLEEKKETSAKEARCMKVRAITSLALVYHYMALVSSDLHRGPYETQSLNLHKKAIEISQRHLLSEELHHVYIQFTTFFRDRAQHESAIRYAEEAYKRAKVVRNKQWQINALSVLVEINLQTGDLEAAKRFLKKSYRLNHSSEKKAAFRGKLKAVLRIQQMKTKIEDPLTSESEKFKLHEKVADIFCDQNIFLHAIEHYKAQEAMFSSLDTLTGKQKASVYYSLAATTLDLGNLETAIEYFQNELQYLTEPLGLSKTWTQIGTCKEKLGTDPPDVEACFKKAHKYAAETEDCKLQYKTLNLLVEFQEKHKLPSAADNRQKVWDLQVQAGPFVDGVEGDSEDMCGSGNTAPQTADDTEDGDSSEDDSDNLVDEELQIVSSDDSDAEENRKTRVTGKVWRKKLNEKGETTLHRACIEGHLKRVQLLLEQGHPLDVPDHAGWVPLHEASNHGFKEIVRLLLDKGANINYRTSESEGITPIQDAACNGHLDIVAFLMERGANPNIKDDKGRTTLSFLETWFAQDGDDLDSYGLESYWKIHASLLEYEKNHSAKENTIPVSRLEEMNDIFDSETNSQRTEPTSALLSQPRRTNIHRQDTEHDVIRRRHNRHDRTNASPDPDLLPSQMRQSQKITDFEDDGPMAGVDGDSNDSQVLPTLNPVRRHQRNSLGRERGDDVDGDVDDGHNLAEISGADVYRQALVGLGGSDSIAAYSNIKKSARAPKRPSVEPVERNSALLQEDNHDGDDWLIDDVTCSTSNSGQRSEIRPSKRPKTVHLSAGGQTTFGNYGWQRPSTVKKASTKNVPTGFSSSFLNRSSIREKPASKKLITTKIKDFMPERGNRDDDDVIIEDDNDQIPSSLPGSVPRRNVTSVPSSYVAMNDQPQATQPLSTSMRIKVEINGKMFLVAAQKSATILWLSERASEIYKRSSGVKPKLSLYSGGTLNEGDACLLANDDLVGDILQPNERVLGKVESWETVLLSQKYEDACKEGKSVAVSTILDACQQSDITRRMDLKNRGFTCTHLKPLMSVLGQQKITSLLLPGNRLDDNGMAALCESMSKQMTLNSAMFEPTLIELNLRGVNMSPSGLKKLAEAASCGALQNLESLDISYNRLGDLCVEGIATILKSCTRMKSFKASRCRFTRQMFQTHYQAFRSAMQGCVHLMTLDFSNNNIGSFGAEMLLKSLPANSLISLNLSGVCDQTNNSILMRHVMNYVTQDSCQLQTLHLSKNQLRKDVIEELKGSTKVEIC